MFGVDRDIKNMRPVNLGLPGNPNGSEGVICPGELPCERTYSTGIS